jgi:hypothetical protein
MVGDMEQAWYFRCGRCLDQPCLFTMYLTRPWYMSPSGLGLLSVCVNCSLSVVAYLGRRESTFSNLPRGSSVKILRKSLGMLQMDLVSLMSRLSIFLMSGIEKGATQKAYSMPRRMIELRILIFCCKEDGERSKVVLSMVI